jgi:hypothetical protein
MNESVFPPVPAHAPQLAPSRAAALSRWLYARCGWRVAGVLPVVP